MISVGQSHSEKLLKNFKNSKTLKIKNWKSRIENWKLKTENKKIENWSYYYFLQQMLIRKLKNDV